MCVVIRAWTESRQTNACEWVCECVCVHVCVCVYTSTYFWLYITQIIMCVCLSVYLCLYMHLCTHLCACICECVHVCVCMCVYTCMHSYNHVPVCDTGRQKGEEGKEKSIVREAEQFMLAHVGMMTVTVELKQGITDYAEETIPNHSITTEGTSPVEPSCRLNSELLRGTYGVACTDRSFPIYRGGRAMAHIWLRRLSGTHGVQNIHRLCRFDNTISMLMLLFSQAHPFKPCIGDTW